MNKILKTVGRRAAVLAVAALVFGGGTGFAVEVTQQEVQGWVATYLQQNMSTYTSQISTTATNAATAAVKQQLSTLDFVPDSTVSGKINVTVGGETVKSYTGSRDDPTNGYGYKISDTTGATSKQLGKVTVEHGGSAITGKLYIGEGTTADKTVALKEAKTDSDTDFSGHASYGFDLTVDNSTTPVAKVRAGQTGDGAAAVKVTIGSGANAPTREYSVTRDQDNANGGADRFTFKAAGQELGNVTIMNAAKADKANTATSADSATNASDMSDGTYVNANSTIAANFGSLDTQVKTNTDAVDQNKTNIQALKDSKADKTELESGLASKVDNTTFAPVQQQVETNKNDIAAEKSAREAVATRLSSLSQQVTANNNSNADAIQDEANAREAEDEKLNTAINQETQARENAVSRLNDRINRTNKEIDQVGAMSMAIAGLHPLDYEDGDARFQIAAAVGTYDGTQAVALGGFYHFNHDAMISFGMTTDTSDFEKFGANIGYTRRIGQGGHHTAASADVSGILQDIQELKAKQASLEAENEELKAKLAALQK